MSEFNPTTFVPEFLTTQLQSTIQELAIRSIRHCADKYGFNPEEAISELGLLNSNLSVEPSNPLIKKKSEPKPKRLVESSEVRRDPKPVKQRKVPEPKATFPLPYNGEHHSTKCEALRLNHGLYTQCHVARKGDALYCGNCMPKDATDLPDYGTIHQRMAVGIMEFVDPKGRRPVPYAKIMEKFNLTPDMVLEEAAKFNMIIDPVHFFPPSAPSTKKKRARPNVTPKDGLAPKIAKVLVEQDHVNDFFEDLLNENEEEQKADMEDEPFVEERPPVEEQASVEEQVPVEEQVSVEEQVPVEAQKKEQHDATEQEPSSAEIGMHIVTEEEPSLEAQISVEETCSSPKPFIEPIKLSPKANPIWIPHVNNATPVDKNDIKIVNINGVRYLRSRSTHIIYDLEKYMKKRKLERIGKYNQKEKAIMFDAKSNEFDLSESEEELEEPYDH